ncbi:MAG: APC family permease, partial [Rhodanobacteraceae bacterium]
TFTGMEVALCASGEVRQPCHTIPRALTIAMVSVTLLYVAIQVIAQGILGAALATSTVPLADAMARISPMLQTLLLAGAAISMLGYLGSDVLATPRMLFAFSRDGMLPSVLGRVHPRTRVPHVAILSYATLAIVFALTGSFTELAVLATLAVTVPYIAGCAAAFQLARRGVAQSGPPLNFRGLGIAAVVGITSMGALIALASRTEILGLGGAIAVCIGLYLALNRGAAARQMP